MPHFTGYVNYLSMLELKLNHISERGPRSISLSWCQICRRQQAPVVMMTTILGAAIWTLHKCHGFSNQRQLNRFPNNLLRLTTKKILGSALQAICDGKPPVTSGFHSQIYIYARCSCFRHIYDQIRICINQAAMDCWKLFANAPTCTWAGVAFYMKGRQHYNDVIMGAMASQITSLAIVYSSVYLGQIKENMKAPRHWPLWGEFTGDRWIPHPKGQ